METKETLSSFEEELINQFGAAIALSNEETKEVLFGNKNATEFVDVSGEDKLIHVRELFSFVEKLKQAGMAEKDVCELLFDQIGEVKRTAYQHIEKARKDGAIGVSEYESRIKNFIAATRDEKSKEKISLNAQKVLGRSLFAEVQ